MVAGRPTALSVLLTTPHLDRGAARGPGHRRSRPAPHPPRLPRPILDPIAGLPRLPAHRQPAPAAQLAHRLPDLHVVDVHAVLSKRRAQVERLAGVTRCSGRRIGDASLRPRRSITNQHVARSEARTVQHNRFNLGTRAHGRSMAAIPPARAFTPAHGEVLQRPAWRCPAQIGTIAAFAAEQEDDEKVPFCRAKSGAPNGIRIRAAGLKGRCPRPLDDGGTRVPPGEYTLPRSRLSSAALGLRRSSRGR